MKTRRNRYIIAADTVVDFEGKCITKPSSIAEAVEFLKMFSGRKQVIFTAVAFVRPFRKGRIHKPEIHVGMSSVRFRKLNNRIISDYFSKVDPMDKAGAYDIDQHGDMIIESHTGSWSNISGLPAEIVALWLAKEGLYSPAPKGSRTNKPCARRGI
jgi:septum formation protein